ncbi:MAG: putative Signal transduction histidine kinase [Promethearchaeota archaeon]|nr:MAG: putative Signal transduction histidine kinase [Candidatus Lokiarchaeota archaeon]
MFEEEKQNITYKDLFENAPYPSIIFNLDGHIVDINKELEKLFGYSKRDIIGKNFRDLTTYEKDQGSNIEERYRKLLDGKIPPPQEIKCVKKDGTLFYGLSRVSLITLKEKKYIQGIIYDITDKKLTEAKLKDSQKKYELITKNIYDFVAVLNSEFCYEFNNQPITQKLMGYKNEDLYGESVFKFIHPKDRKKAIEKLNVGFKEGTGSATIRFQHKKGYWIWLEVKGKTFRDIDGKMKALVISRNITERKEGELELLKLSKMVEQSSDAIIRTDTNFKITYINKAAEELYGYTFEEIKGRTPEIFNAEKESELEQSQIYETVSKGQMYKNELLNQKKDGTSFYCEMRISPLINEKEKIIGYLGLQRDITNRKKAKRKVLKARNRSEFFKDLLAHDISNILNNIKASTHLIENWKDERTKKEEIDELIEIIKKQIQRGSSLISNVHKLSETKNIKRSIQQVDINKTIEIAIDHLLGSFNKKQIHIKKKNDKCISVLGGEFLSDAIENILINSVLHNENTPIKIWINFSQIENNNHNYLKIEFKDNGIGIIDQRKVSIFERSYQKKSTSGMGIGLSLVKKIITAYEGEVWVEDRVEGEPSKGSNFVILLKKI